MRFYVLVCVFLWHSLLSFGQHAILKKSITGYARPSDGAGIQISKVPAKNGDFSSTGYNVGDTIPDFTLYTTDGVAVDIDSVLDNNKPVLLVSGSYSCPSTRSRINDFNNITRNYGYRLNTFLVYVVEAHPAGQQCPYMGFGSSPEPKNNSMKLKVTQENTYGARKKTAIAMKQDLNIIAPVLIDGPNNEWWSHFGPAPNNAYLINSKGVIVAKNGWFNDPNSDRSMWCSIDDLLGTNSHMCKR